MSELSDKVAMRVSVADDRPKDLRDVQIHDMPWGTWFVGNSGLLYLKTADYVVWCVTRNEKSDFHISDTGQPVEVAVTIVANVPVDSEQP